MPKPSPWGEKVEPPDTKKFLQNLALKLNEVDNKWVEASGEIEEFLESYSGRLSNEEKNKFDGILSSVIQSQRAHVEIIKKIGEYLGEW
jgi:ribonucleotide reductase beta subunit family protein with ferritin-like domain